MTESYTGDFLNRNHMKEIEQMPSSTHRFSPISGAVIIIVTSVLLLAVVFHTTTPLSAGPLGILIVFIVAYALCVALFFLLISTIASVLRRLDKVKGLSTRRIYYVASVLGFVPVLYLTLSAMGGVTFWGVSLIFVFVGLSLFYVLRRL
jgi:hypothetical protein